LEQLDNRKEGFLPAGWQDSKDSQHHKACIILCIGKEREKEIVSLVDLSRSPPLQEYK